MMMMIKTKGGNYTLGIEIVLYPAQSQSSAMAMWL